MRTNDDGRVTVVPPPLAGTGPTPKLWTCDEFHRLFDSWKFKSLRPLLVDGVILEQGMMNPPHAIAVELAEGALRATFGAGWRFRGSLPLVLGLDTDPMPDIAVLAGPVRGAITHPTTADLVVEISDTTLAFDTGEKRRLYASTGVPDYWVLDLNGRRLLAFRDPSAGDYATQLVFGPADDAVAPLAAPAALVRVADLLP